MTARRDFLRGLVTLPMIGGGVTLIGQPTAVAEPVTTALLHEYGDWLGWERSRLYEEMYGKHGREQERVFSHVSQAYDWHRGIRPKVEGGDFFNSAPAASRAALVLSAVGCEWRE